MDKKIPLATIQAFARSIYKESSKYGFGQLEVIRLVNELMDYCTGQYQQGPEVTPAIDTATVSARDATSLPLIGTRIMIRALDRSSDVDVLKAWLPDKYGRYFVLSSTAAQSVSIDELIEIETNHLAIITTLEEKPVGALAYLDNHPEQKRAELRKLIGDPEYRGMGLAEEATRLWIDYGCHALKLQKIYVSTLQTYIGNIKLNEKVGFHVEGLLRDEVLIDGTRHDVLRMGISHV